MAYREFLTARLRSGTALIVGSPEHNEKQCTRLIQRMHNEIIEVAGVAGLAAYRLTYQRPGALSAAVADLYRDWLRRAGKTGNRLLVESGHLTDPWNVVRAGLVPYWCPGTTRTDVDELQEWIAGSQPFSSIDVLPEPPGTLLTDFAPPASWAAAAAFGQRRGVVDPICRRAYPLGHIPHRHAAKVLNDLPYDTPRPKPLTASDALNGLRGTNVQVIAPS
jgi:hypothetical protein